MKAGLEEAARSANRSVAKLLDEIVADHLSSTSDASAGERAHQRRLLGRASRFAGCIAGSVPDRSESVRELVRARLRRRQPRAR